MRMKRALMLLPVFALVPAACGSDDDAAGGSSDAAIVVERAWARTSPAGVTAGAVYFDITATGADTLLAASVPSAVAAGAEIHEVVAADTDMTGDEMTGHEMTGDEHESMDTSGDDGETAMVMQQLTDGLALPAGEPVSLAPGGYHVMLLDLASPLGAGGQFDLTLDFATADDMTISVTVGDAAPES
jgi:copper(I)-binding protein